MQIQQLQHSMQDILRVMSMFSQGAVVNLSDQNGIATQTDIIAVHTPQVNVTGLELGKLIKKYFLFIG